MHHRFRSGVLRFRSTLSYSRRALRHRPILRTPRSLLFSDHRPKRTLGFVGLRIRRSGSLSLCLTRLDPEASATRAFPPRQLDRLLLEQTKSISRAGTRMTVLTCFTAAVAPERLFTSGQRIASGTLPRSVNDHGMVDRVGATEVDPPRLVHPCHADPVNVSYQISPLVSLAIIVMFGRFAAIASRLLVVPPVSSKPADLLPTGWRLVADLIVPPQQQIDE